MGGEFIRLLISEPEGCDTTGELEGLEITGEPEGWEIVGRPEVGEGPGGWGTLGWAGWGRETEGGVDWLWS